MLKECKDGNTGKTLKGKTTKEKKQKQKIETNKQKIIIIDPKTFFQYPGFGDQMFYSV